LIHRLPGTTFSNTQERGDYPSEELASLTLEEIESFVLRWVVDVYHQKTHRGLYGKTPIEIWRTGEIGRTPRMPNDLDALEAVLGMRRSARVHHYGIELDSQQYHCPELGELARRLGPEARVDVRFRDELGYVWVHDPIRNNFLQVHNKDKEMVGMSRDIYKAARARVRDEKGDANDRRQVRTAYAKILAEAEAARKSNKLRQRKFAAKLKTDPEGQPRSAQTMELGASQSNPMPAYEPPSELPTLSIRSRSS
jgi:putative transposase